VVSHAGYEIEPSVEHTQRDWLSLRNQHVVMQQFDYSCAAASLATLLQYYFEDEVSELNLVQDATDLFSDRSLAVIESQGLSFLELEQLATARGYQAASVELAPEALSRLSGPVIVYLHTPQFRHFVVLRKASSSRVLLADPSLGNINMSMDAFLKIWQGYTLVLGKPDFGTPTQHPLRAESTQALSMGKQLLTNRPDISPWMYIKE